MLIEKTLDPKIAMNFRGTTLTGCHGGDWKQRNQFFFWTVTTNEKNQKKVYSVKKHKKRKGRKFEFVLFVNLEQEYLLFSNLK